MAKVSKEKEALMKLLQGSKIKETVEEDKELEVVEEGSEDESLPIADAKCSQCGNDKARYWLKQMRAGDEPETQFFKCTECSNIWRD